MQAMCSPSPYMSRQHYINMEMRSILVDSLLRVHTKYRLHPSSFWLGVNILDRYLDKGDRQVCWSEFQLVGITSLLIAVKFEDLRTSAIFNCGQFCDNLYTRKQVCQMEFSILTTLNYEIFIPTGYHFLTRYLDVIQASDRLRFLAYYYAERNLQEYDTLREMPHLFSASAVYAALVQSKSTSEQPRWNNSPAWSKLLQDETGLKESDLIRCARSMIQHVGVQHVTGDPSHHCLLTCAKRKYSLAKFLNVSSLDLPVI